MLTDELVLGTHNRKKLRELKQLFEGTGIRIRSLDEFSESISVEEDGSTFRANAEKKASEQAIHLKKWVIGEDSGICVKALKGKPGVYSARFAGPDADDETNNRKLIEELNGASDRSAHYVCHVALSDPTGKIVLNVEATCRGEIAAEPRGTGGFGYDPYFLIPEYDMTMAELGDAVKNVLSHRARAMREFLRQFFRINTKTEKSATGP